MWRAERPPLLAGLSTAPRTTVPAKLRSTNARKCGRSSPRASLGLRPPPRGGVICAGGEVRRMATTIERRPQPDDPALPFWARLAWLAALALSGLLAAAGVAYL